MFHGVKVGRSKCEKNKVICSVVFSVVIMPEVKLSESVTLPASKSAQVSTDKDIERLESLPSVGTATSFLISNPVVSPVSKFHLSSC